MKIFIDTANIEQIKKANDMGLIDGVTTNPSLVSKENKTMAEVIPQICEIVDGPISAEVMSLDSEGMIREARELVKISKNITYLGQIPDTIDFENRKLMGQIEVDGEYKNDYIIDDSALLYETQDGIYIITGCSHSGICNIIEYAKKVSKKDNVLGIIGGTHLQEINNQLYKTIDYFKANNIKELYPCHCTKFYVKAEMFKYLNIKDAHVGLEINW